MKTESTIKPSVKFEVEAEPKSPGVVCKVILYDDIQGPFERAAVEGTESYFTYDRYELDATYREDLETSIQGNLQTWIDAAKAKEESEAAANVRKERNRRLAEIDWTQTIDAPISQKSREALRTYRQELRNITEQPGFPEEVIWPVRPEITKADPDPVDEALDVLIGEETEKDE